MVSGWLYCVFTVYCVNVCVCVLTWVQSTCRDWPGTRWRRRRRSWRWYTRRHVQTARGGSNEAARCTAWRGGWRWSADPPGQEASCCPYQAAVKHSDVNLKTSNVNTGAWLRLILSPGVQFRSEHMDYYGSLSACICTCREFLFWHDGFCCFFSSVGTKLNTLCIIKCKLKYPRRDLEPAKTFLYILSRHFNSRNQKG